MGELKVHKITNASEMIGISHLINGYFKEYESHLNYTKKDFLNRLLPLLYNDKNLFLYVTEDDRPVAYMCVFEVNLFVNNAVMPFQIYPNNARYMIEMAKELDRWTVMRGFKEQVFLVLPKARPFFSQNFNAKTQLIYMTRQAQKNAEPISVPASTISTDTGDTSRESTGDN